jgi:hypothetical protein
LFWIVGDIAGQNRVNLANISITAPHLDSILPSILQGLQDYTHGLVEDPLNFGSMLEFCHS